jgi:hypothetical protein
MRRGELEEIATVFKLVENKLKTGLERNFKQLDITKTNTELWLSPSPYKKDINVVFRINTRLKLWSIRFITFTEFLRAKVVEHKTFLEAKLGENVIFTETWKGIYEEHKLPDNLRELKIEFVVERLCVYITVFTELVRKFIYSKNDT